MSGNTSDCYGMARELFNKGTVDPKMNEQRRMDCTGTGTHVICSAEMVADSFAKHSKEVSFGDVVVFQSKGQQLLLFWHWLRNQGKGILTLCPERNNIVHAWTKKPLLHVNWVLLTRGKCQKQPFGDSWDLTSALTNVHHSLDGGKLNHAQMLVCLLRRLGRVRGRALVRGSPTPPLTHLQGASHNALGIIIMCIWIQMIDSGGEDWLPNCPRRQISKHGLHVNRALMTVQCSPLWWWMTDEQTGGWPSGESKGQSSRSS